MRKKKKPESDVNDFLEDIKATPEYARAVYTLCLSLRTSEELERVIEKKLKEHGLL